MAGGAVVAAAAAAHAKRIQNVVDAFRLAEATSPDRSRALTEVIVAVVGALAALAGVAIAVMVARGSP
jgi:hypothetical protein